MNDKKKFSININYNLIQSIRLVQSLHEASDNLIINKIHKKKFKILEKYFDLKFNYNVKKFYDISPHIKYSHSAPFIKIGNIQRTLIFPHKIINRLILSWKKNKIYDFSFVGIYTSSRKIIINDWLNNKFRSKNIIDNKFSYLKNLVVEKTIKREYFDSSKILILSSKKGRKFPKKSWDNNYYNILLKSKFVLCPSGDFIWSYRFFESILCGAIPIVENHCKAYDGFRYYTFNNNLNELIYNDEIINHNLDLCLKKITIPTNILKKELELILNEK